MTAPAITDRRRLHWHAPEKGSAPAFALSLFAHALLFFAIAFVVRWKTEPAGTISAECIAGDKAAVYVFEGAGTFGVADGDAFGDPRCGRLDHRLDPGY